MRSARLWDATSSRQRSGPQHCFSRQTWPAASPARSPTWTAVTTSWAFDLKKRRLITRLAAARECSPWNPEVHVRAAVGELLAGPDGALRATPVHKRSRRASLFLSPLAKNDSESWRLRRCAQLWQAIGVPERRNWIGVLRPIEWATPQATAPSPQLDRPTAH